MTARSLRATFALLLRDQQRSPATLNARAERTIRRRVVTRWTGRAAALAAVTGLGAFAVTGALGTTADETITMPSLTPTPTLGLAVATFPFEGGPEFAVASSAYRCGDPAPAPHPQDHDLQIAATPYIAGAGGDPFSWASVSPLQALITKTADANLGVVGTSGIDMLVVKDGIVVGMLGGDGPLLDVNSSLYGGPSGVFIPVVNGVRCPAEDPRSPSQGVDPGTYELIAVASAFSTPESVALSQALAYGSSWNLTSRGLDYDSGGLYLPGSYDCQSAVDMQAPARPCLADYTPDATVDTEARTVSLIYRTSDLVEEFSTVLVSEPMTVELVSEDAAGLGSGIDWDSLGSFDTLADLTCGASAPGTNLASDAQVEVAVGVSLDEGRIATLVPGGTFAGTVMTWGIGDGSRVELLPGARLVYFESTSVTVEADSGDGISSMVQVNTVAGWAPVALDGAITTDRYSGPQATGFTAEAATLCPGVESLGQGTLAVAGTWRITAPDGTVTTMDFSSDAGYDEYGAKYSY